MPPEAQPSAVPPGAAAPPSAAAAAATTPPPAGATPGGTPGAQAGAGGTGTDAGAPGKAAATALSADPGQAGAAAAGSDWRAPFGTNEKLTKLLGRFSSAEAFGNAYLEAQSKIGQGIKQPLKEGASEQEVAAYRTEHGIPEKPDGYFEKLPQGLVVGEADKALFSEWASEMHALNAPPAYIAKTVDWYYKMQEQQAANAEAIDRQHQAESKTALRAAWGGEYAENINLLTNFMGGLPEETAAMFRDATLPDGRRLFNSPEIVQWLTQKARELNPLAFVPSAGSGDEGKSLDQRITAIEATMGTAAYLKNEKVQEEYRQLVTRREQLRERAA